MDHGDLTGRWAAGRNLVTGGEVPQLEPVRLSQHQTCRAAYSGLRLSCGLVRTNNCIKSGVDIIEQYKARNATIVR